MTTNCYFCNQPITGPTEHHHPDKTNFPDWTEPAHPECHTRYHQEAGHFKEWGGWTAYKGREGYERAVAKWPAFHSMGGKARAHTATRDERGRFVAETKPFYGLGKPFQTPSSHVRQAWHERTQAQTRTMTAGPFLDDDDFTLVVPSEWYHAAASAFWKSHGFEWRPKTSTWQRDTRRPLRGKRYTPAAWLASTRRKFYQFWPQLDQPHIPRDRRRYVEGEYSAYIEH